MKACYRCGLQAEGEFCSRDGTPLGVVIYEDSVDVIIGVPESIQHNHPKNPGLSGILAYGLHVVCGGTVDRNKSSNGRDVYSCRKCYLRMIRFKEETNESSS